MQAIHKIELEHTTDVRLGSEILKYMPGHIIKAYIIIDVFYSICIDYSTIF